MATINEIINNFPNTAILPQYITSAITFSQSDLTNLTTTPKLLIAAPGNGFANILTGVIVSVAAGTQYSGSSSVNVVNGSNVTVTGSTVGLGVTASGAAVLSSSAISGGGTSSTYTNLNNQAIYLKNNSTALTGGNQTLKLWARYYVLPLV